MVYLYQKGYYSLYIHNKVRGDGTFYLNNKFSNT